MINEYILHLIKNLQKDVHFPQEIDLVLSGGAFNGSYMLGSLYYLRELEHQGKINIHKISGSSIGSILGLFYIADRLDLFNELYSSCFDSLVEHRNLSKLLQLKTMLKDQLPSNLCELVQDKLYISYHNIRSGRKCVKHRYKNTDELMDCIIRSCYVPFLINYRAAYKNKYIDGMLPFFFKQKKSKTKVLYINLITHDKASHMLAVKNEYTNMHRVLIGISDIHQFFIKNKNTYMCSYIDNWSLYEYVVYYLSLVIEKSILYTLYVTKDICNIKLVRSVLKECIKCVLSTILSL